MITHPEYVTRYAVIYTNPCYQSVEAVSDVLGEAVYDACDECAGLKAGILEDYTEDQPDIKVFGITYEPLRVLESVDPVAYGELADEAVSWLVDYAQCDFRDYDVSLCLYEDSTIRYDLYVLPATIPDDDMRGLLPGTLHNLGYVLRPSEDGPGVWIHASVDVPEDAA